MTTVKDEIRVERLNHYQGRDPHAFAQFDGFSDVPMGDVMNPDQDGDSVCSSTTYELMSGAPAVRVLIAVGTDSKTALRLLKKIRNWIKRGGLDDYKIKLMSMQTELDVRICPTCGAREPGALVFQQGDDEWPF